MLTDASSRSLRRWSVEEYQRMAEVGILDPAERVELLDGEIVAMSPIGPAHAGVVNRLASLLITALGATATVVVQNPLRLEPNSQPQPDVLVARYRSDFYDSDHPTAKDALLLIEVSDSTLSYDRTHKLAIYARERVPEVWIVDVSGGVVHVFRDPDQRRYRTECTATGAEQLVAARVEGELVLTPDQILGH